MNEPASVLDGDIANRTMASSPITFPDSPPAKMGTTMARQTNGVSHTTKPKAKGPFMMDDSDNDDENENGGNTNIQLPPMPTNMKRPSPGPQKSTMSKSRGQGPFDMSEDEESDGGVPDLGSLAAARDAGLPYPKRVMVNDPRELSSQDTPIFTQRIPSRQPDTHASTNDNQTTTSESQESSAPWSLPVPIFSGSLKAPSVYTIKTCNGSQNVVTHRQATQAESYESMVAQRTKTKEGRAKKAYYGIDIHELMDAATKETTAKKSAPPPVEPNRPLPSVEKNGKKPKKTLLWTEKYRARNFMDLCGDDGTNRQVLRWLKKWDSTVFPGMQKAKPIIPGRTNFNKEKEEEKPHRKILLLTGPPGLGKTTLAHVCARQAGYEVMEINASDDRSRDVVKTRIRTSLGTESVKNVTNKKQGAEVQKTAKPACVVVDEVDGVVSGSGGSGEGGFVKALIDLVLTDQRNSESGAAASSGKKKKGDDFRLMRPLILICNDVYHPSLRPLRQSNLAEIIHAGRPQMDAVVARLKAVFEKEGIPCEKDAARKLCEAAWGITSGIDAKRGTESTVEGDLRGVMVVGEWVAGRFKASPAYGNGNLTKQWIEASIMHDLTSGAAGSRGLGRGSVKDIVARLFQEGGGFPKQAMSLGSSSRTLHEQPKTELGLGEQTKRYAMERLREMIDASGEIGHIITEIFAEYPNREYNDDLYLTKPNEAYDWLHFHDVCQSRLYASQEWELAPYLSQPVLAWHHLFASPKRHFTAEQRQGFGKRWGQEEEEVEVPLPFSGPRGDYQAFEAEKMNRAQLGSMAADLSPTMMRLFRSAEDMATDLLPYLTRMVSPDVKPVVVGGSAGSTASVRKDSDKAMVKRAAQVLAEVGITLQKGKIEGDGIGSQPSWVYRMEPDLDTLATYETASSLLLPSQAPTRFAVRQVLDQELQRTVALREALAREARFRGDDPDATPRPALPTPSQAMEVDKESKPAVIVKRDFFGRIVVAKPLAEMDEVAQKRAKREERKCWVTYHEGLNNAVRKPISVQEFLGGL